VASQDAFDHDRFFTQTAANPIVADYQGAPAMRILSPSRWVLGLLTALTLMACQQNAPSAIAAAPLPYSVDVLSDELEGPWGLDFLPDGQMLITERQGSLKRFNPQNGSLQTIENVPAVFYQGQGGLLDVRLHPQFEQNHWVYLSFSVELEDGHSSTRVIRAKLEGNALGKAETIWQATPAFETAHHYGCALLFDNDGNLWVTMGDRGRRHNAQLSDKANGKVLRLLDDGRPHPENPDFGTDAIPGIFSLGHRNPQGITINRSTGNIWTAEHGPRGGDEINMIRPGLNYGWPVITYGEEYRGGKIGEGTHKEGMAQPLHYYVPSIATAGIEYYDGDALPFWKNSLFVVGLSSLSVSRVQLNAEGAKTLEERLLEDMKLRLREVRQGPDGLLYLLAENGELLRISPRS
jgi:glucose/arabinose dehydrogenase